MQKLTFLIGISLLVFLTSCSTSVTNASLQRVGLLLEDTIDDQGWNAKGYQGLLNIQSAMEVDVFFKESIDNFAKAESAIKEFDEEGVKLIFGHGRVFADFFNEIKERYPHIHFVSFNGEVDGENITSIHFKSEALGFFAGMVAAEMSQTKKLGVIAAFPWQPEVKGFEKGAKFHKEDVEVLIEYVHDWTDTQKAFSIFQTMKEDGVDVYYPAGDGYHVPLVQEIKNEGLYAIGFVGDQADLGITTVLTSTVQHVDFLYQVVAERFSKGELKSGNMYYDFQDGVVSLGTFSSAVPEKFQEMIKGEIHTYIETGKLPEQK